MFMRGPSEAVARRPWAPSWLAVEEEGVLAFFSGGRKGFGGGYFVGYVVVVDAVAGVGGGFRWGWFGRNGTRWMSPVCTTGSTTLVE